MALGPFAKKVIAIIVTGHAKKHVSASVLPSFRLVLPFVEIRTRAPLMIHEWPLRAFSCDSDHDNGISALDG